jgi:L-ribulose-5-phosphate 4-epimerase
MINELKKEICKISVLAYEKGMVVGSGGNISAREGNHIYITPHGFVLGDMKPQNIICVNLDGTYEGDIKPSIETGLHLQCYKEDPEINAVIHLHSYYSTVVAIRERKNNEKVMPAYTLGYYIKVGDVSTIPVFKSGSVDLINAVVEKLRKGSNAVLMKNHGIIVVGTSLIKAFSMCEDIEFNAKMHMQMNGEGALTEEKLKQIFVN